MTSFSAGQIILTPTQPVGSGDRTQDLLTRSHAGETVFSNPKKALAGNNSYILTNVFFPP